MRFSAGLGVAMGVLVAGCNGESVRPCVEESACDATPDVRVMFRSGDSSYAQQIRVAVTAAGETRWYTRPDFQQLAGELFIQHALASAESVTVTVSFTPGDSAGAARFSFLAGEYTRNHIHLFVRPSFHGVPVCERLVGTYRVAMADSLSVLFGAWDRRSTAVDC